MLETLTKPEMVELYKTCPWYGVVLLCVVVGIPLWTLTFAIGDLAKALVATLEEVILGLLGTIEIIIRGYRPEPLELDKLPTNFTFNVVKTKSE